MRSFRPEESPLRGNRPRRVERFHAPTHSGEVLCVGAERTRPHRREGVRVEEEPGMILPDEGGEVRGDGSGGKGGKGKNGEKEKEKNAWEAP